MSKFACQSGSMNSETVRFRPVMADRRQDSNAAWRPHVADVLPSQATSGYRAPQHAPHSPTPSRALIWLSAFSFVTRSKTAQRRSRAGAIGSAKLAHVVQSSPYQRHRSPLPRVHLAAEPFELW